MNPLASPKCAARLLMALAAIATILSAVGCGSSSSSPAPNPGGFSNTSLNGTYVISISGTDINNSSQIVPFSIVGTITTVGGGTFTGGTIDVNDPDNTGVNLAQTVSGTYSISSDGRGTGTLTTPAAGSFGIDFVLTSTSHGLITRYDNVGTGSGTIDLQTSPIPIPAGSFAFSLSGAIASTGNPLGTVGAFTLDSSGNIEANTGTEDFNDDGTGFPDLALSGFVNGSTSGPGTAQLTTNSGLGALNFDVFVIDSTHMKFIENDTADSGILLSGDAFTQVTSLSAGQLVFALGGIDSSGYLVVAGGYATTDANGNLTNGVEDYNDDGTVGLAKPFSTSSAFCNTSTGRCQLTLDGFSNGASGSFTFAVYPSSGGGQALEIDSLGLLQGTSYSQSATAFTATAGYALNLFGQNGNGEVDDIAQFDSTSAVSPATNMTGILDENNTGGTDSGALTGTDTPDSPVDGRGSIAATTPQSALGGLTLEYYVVDSSTVVFIDVDSTASDAGQGGVGIFQAQSSSSSSVAARKAMSIVHPMARPHAALRRK
ncbi:MAG: hypothetical protein WCF68_15375 [Terriglobales bacterium]